MEPVDVPVDRDVAADANTVPPDVTIIADAPPDALEQDACAPNACGGCGPLGGTPGAACGQCGKYVCSPDNTSLTCDDPGYVTYTQISNFCGLTTTGQVRCWGASQDHRTVVLSGVKALGERALCAVMTNGTLRCWGSNDDINVELLSGIKAATTNRVNCALSEAGGVRCWGYNGMGQVGTGTNDPQPAPAATDILTGVKQINTAWSYVCAVMNNTGVRCWGTPSGELGLPFVPASAPDLFTGVAQVASEQFHRCVVMTDGNVRCWGDNSFGQLGDGTHATSDAPGVSVLNGIQSVGVGSGHSCALSTNGAVRCWGNYLDGEAGYSAQAAAEFLTGVQAISSDGACALMNTGAVQCWPPPYRGVTTPTPVTRICP